MKFFSTLAVTLFLCQQIAAQVPSISSFAPISGPIGLTVTISGTNFSSTPINNIVYFGSVRATVTNASATALQVNVPAGTTYKPISVTVNGLTAFSLKPFAVSFPGAGSFNAGSFGAKTDYSSGSGTSCVISCDLDGDGKPELISVNDLANTLTVFKNISSTGAIAFSPKIDFVTGAKPFCVVSGDLDGDGKPDLAVANGGSNSISIFRNTSAGIGNISFAPKTDLATSATPYCVIISDFDRDGKADIASANSNSTVSVFKNNSVPGNFSFSSKSDFTTGTSPYWIAAGDLDNDGLPDIASANGTANNAVSVLRNISTPGIISFAAKIDLNGGSNSNAIEMADINGDGKLDLAIAGDITLVLLNTSTGSPSVSFANLNPVLQGNPAIGITVSDLDGDTQPDIIIENFSNNISLYRNTLSLVYQSFESGRNYSVGITPWVSVAVDLDGDGRPDIATANYGSGNITVRRNQLSAIGIQNVLPISAGTGTAVNINGNNLSGVTGVKFGGIPAASFTVVSANLVTAVVGSGASGNVTLIAGIDSASFAGFNFLPAPTISSFSPAIAGMGYAVSITGTNFSNVDSITFGGVKASSFTITSTTQINAIVDTGSTGTLNVYTKGGKASAAGFTFVPAPIINSFTPTDATIGGVVTINGKNFSGANQVFFGETAAASFTILSNNRITAVVNNKTGGAVSVTTLFGTGKLGGFYNGHTITSFSPKSGYLDSTVMIFGENFNVLPDSNQVFFGAVKAKIISGNKNVLAVKVPSGSTYKPISVLTGKQIAVAGLPYIQTFANNDTLFSEKSFSKKDFTAGLQPVGIYISDVDGDGKADIIVGNGGGVGTVAIFRNSSVKGNISFNQINLLLPPGITNTFEVAAEDLNGDGKPEIITWQGGSTFIFENNSSAGQISFLPATEFMFSNNTFSRLSVCDIDGDGKQDIALSNEVTNKVVLYRNTTANGIISFDTGQDYNTGVQPRQVILGDLDGDKKPDMLVSNSDSTFINVYKNTSTPGVISFTSVTGIDCPYGLGTIILADFESDGRLDVAASYTLDSTIYVYRNTTFNGNISFATPIIKNVGINIYDFGVQDLNGDGKPEIGGVSINSGKLYILKNESTIGSIIFTSKLEFDTGSDPPSLGLTDFDGDGKADIAISNFHANSISVFRNKIGEATSINLCPPVANTSILSDLQGSSYQWQLNAGGGFVNLLNNANYLGTNTPTLSLANVPSSWYGYKYRCTVDGKYSEVSEIKFVDQWIGNVSSSWENPANWSCNTVPDMNTDVAITGGSIVINSNVTIRSLKVSTGATVTVNSGFKLTILH